jgi:hypothetical protein
MTALLKNRFVRRFGLWYLAYEAVSLVVFAGFGIHFLPFH